MRCLLIQTENKLILIDTGIGEKQSEKFFNYFYLHGKDNLKKSITRIGFSCNEVTDVILTHLHFDHCGGAVLKDGNKLLFPNAQHWTNSEHWYWAINPNKREKASFLKENFLPIKKNGKLNFLKEGEFLNNIKIRFYYGHTHAQIIPFITLNGKTLVFCADLLPSTGHIPLPYVMGYDVNPLITLKEKEIFLNEAYEKEYILFLEHDYFNECCIIEKNENKFRVKRVGKLKDFID
jgi:glyoxylase-like metal-dependent hydrolase (beta-lactamase superfamily II)